MARLRLDSGAVIALARRDATARRVIEQAVSRRSLTVIPAPVIAETTRGGHRDAAVNRVLAAVDEITPVTEAIARQAGRLLATSGLDATVDALVAAEATLGGAAVVLTGDARDLSALVSGHPRVHVHGL